MKVMLGHHRVGVADDFLHERHWNFVVGTKRDKGVSKRMEAYINLGALFGACFLSKEFARGGDVGKARVFNDVLAVFVEFWIFDTVKAALLIKTGTLATGLNTAGDEMALDFSRQGRWISSIECGCLRQHKADVFARCLGKDVGKGCVQGDADTLVVVSSGRLSWSNRDFPPYEVDGSPFQHRTVAEAEACVDANGEKCL